MRIVYVGQLWSGGTCGMRYEALKSLGHDVVGIDTTPPAVTGPLRALTGRLRTRFGEPPDRGGVNAGIREAVAAGSIDVLWVDKGLLVKPETLRWVKRVSPSTRLVHYNPDDPFGGHGTGRWRRFLRALPFYDVHFVPRNENFEEYRARRARAVLRASKGFSPEIHRPRDVTPEDRLRLGGPVGFIGAAERPRAEEMLALARAGIPVRVWGIERWGPWRGLDPRLVIDATPLWGDDYARALASFDINLCFLRKANRDRATSRTFEIPACGGFMLGERTEEHLGLFEEGKEAEFFGSTEELIDKVRFYLTHDELRRRIASAGRERCIRSGYDYPSRMAKMLVAAGSDA